jgi:hypothetical protein
MPIYPKPGQAKIYIQALEERVAELEGMLSREGHDFVSKDHWADTTTTTVNDDEGSDEAPDMRPLLNAVRDLSLDAAGSYVGGASSITLGRALEAALAGKTRLLTSSSWEVEKAQRSLSFVSNGSLAVDTGVRLDQVSSEAANMMVYGYLKHLRVNFPIMCSADVLDLHNRRNALKDVFEFSVLNLIYGLGGHFLNKVSRNSSIVLATLVPNLS